MLDLRRVPKHKCHEFCKLSFIDLNSSQSIDLRKANELLSSIESSVVVVVVVDARNVFDGVNKVESSGPQMQEKHTAIELLAKERLKQAKVTLKWVDGELELADVLTKLGCHDALLRALQLGEWRIVYDPNFQSARRKRSLRYQQSCCDTYWLHCLFSLDLNYAKSKEEF